MSVLKDIARTEQAALVELVSMYQVRGDTAAFRLRVYFVYDDSELIGAPLPGRER